MRIAYTTVGIAEGFIVSLFLALLLLQPPDPTSFVPFGLSALAFPFLVIPLSMIGGGIWAYMRAGKYSVADIRWRTLSEFAYVVVGLVAILYFVS